MNKTVKLTPLPELPSYSVKQVPLVLTVASDLRGQAEGFASNSGLNQKLPIR